MARDMEALSLDLVAASGGVVLRALSHGCVLRRFDGAIVYPNLTILIITSRLGTEGLRLINSHVNKS